MRPKRKKVMITGGAGFIGLYVVGGLVTEDIDGMVVGNLNDGTIDNLSELMDTIEYTLEVVREGMKHIFQNLGGTN